MRIIKDGTKEREHTCNACKTVFVYDMTDVTSCTSKTFVDKLKIKKVGKNAYRYTSIIKTYIHSFVVCPVCGKNVSIDKTYAPHDIDYVYWEEQELAKMHNMSIKQFRKYAKHAEITVNAISKI